MKRASGLFPGIVRFDNLLAATAKAARGKQDRIAVASYQFHLESELLALQEELITDRYQPGDFFTFEIRDPKPRQICAAPFRDRVVHHTICNRIEPYFERRLISDSYACRTGKGSHAAVKQAQRFARRYPYFIKCDVRKYFASVDHSVLQRLLRRLFKDRPLLALLDRIIAHAAPGAEPGKGLPIGNLTSQHFANLYLGELDHYLKEYHRLKGYIRYMDDMLLFAEEKEQLHRLLEEVRRFLNDELQLVLKEQALIPAPVTEGIPFLGFRIFPGVVRLDRRSLRRLRRKVRNLEGAWLEGRIGTDCLEQTVASVFAHAAHADTLQLRRALIQQSLQLG